MASFEPKATSIRSLVDVGEKLEKEVIGAVGKEVELLEDVVAAHRLVVVAAEAAVVGQLQVVP